MTVFIFTPRHAREIVEAHEIQQAVDTEAEYLEEGNPDLLYAYRALLAYAEQGS